MENYFWWIAVAIIVGLGIWMFIGGNKKQWYIVYLANNDVELLMRDASTRWWRSSDNYLRFKNEDGEEETYVDKGRWIIKMVAVPANGLDAARKKVQDIKESQRKAFEG